MPAYTWATGETITATKLNTLETEAWRIANQIADGSSTSTSTTTSTSFVDAAASVTFTAKSTSVYIEVFGGNCYAGTANTSAVFIGININGSDYTVCHANTTNSNIRVPFSGGTLVTGLTAGNSYTAKIRIKSNSASYTAGINGTDGIPATSRQSIVVWDISK